MTKPVMSEDVTDDLRAVYNHTKVHDKIPDEGDNQGNPGQDRQDDAGIHAELRDLRISHLPDKAIAVYQGKADLKMCLPYLREKGGEHVQRDSGNHAQWADYAGSGFPDFAV